MTRRPGFFLAVFPQRLVLVFFEYLNRFCQNWYYQGRRHVATAIRTGGQSQFRHILPAVLSMAECWQPFAAPAGFRFEIKNLTFEIYNFEI